jgi:predicted DNA-binding protein
MTQSLPLKRAIAFTVLFFSFFALTARSQDMNSPVGYMSYMSDKARNVTKTYLNYLSAVSHGKSARKVEKLREKVLNTIEDAKFAITGTPPFKGDKTLRDASATYMKICFSVFNEDYSKIVNLEEIAEQSYDAMEAYLLAQQKANEKLNEASKKNEEMVKQFAAKNNIQLIESQDELSIKAEQASKVMDYYNTVFLIFFKSSKQDTYLTEAINAGNLNAAEQSKNALLKYSVEGLQQLEGIKAFDSDLTMVTACKKTLLFYKEMCEKKIQTITDFLLLKENFEKAQKAMNQSSASKRTQADVDKYNKTVNEFNKSVSLYNKTNNELNKERQTLINQWNSTVDRFMDVHIPYSK